MQDKRRFGKTLLMLRHQGFGDATEEDIQLLKAALGKDHTYIDIDDECRMSLEHVKRKIQRNYNEDPLAWWDKNGIEATLKVKEEKKYELVQDPGFLSLKIFPAFGNDNQMLLKKLGLLN
ncbi:hypothetical protein ACS0TY_034058 [Phlomoides rotata]